MSANLHSTPSGQQALRQQVGDRFTADWKSNDHRARRLVAEFIGTSGLTFVLSGGAAILAGYGGRPLRPISSPSFSRLVQRSGWSLRFSFWVISLRISILP